MHLRSLELHGFKAFADRQRFEFGPGITVIVGPNGSGKSNVADAIRWALGEQSARQIRAKRTEDVIFSGSERRRAMGAAEVTLTLDNTEGWMPVDYSEVAVSRRADRSGENEYRVNAQRVRLGDVLDLFRRAQVGQNSYAMMSQGLVDEVLALRPRERRGLIEEAADLGRHRHQLALAERRLTATRDNLGSARLLLREIEPRVRQLERQSRRAERYRELARELADVLSLYLETELRSAQEALAATRAEHDQRQEAFQKAREELLEAQERASELERQRGTLSVALTEAEASERTLEGRVRELEQEQALSSQRDELLATRASELARDVEQLAGGPGAEERQGRLPGADGGGADEASEISGRIASARELSERERRALEASDEEARALLRQLAEAEARRARHEAERDELVRREAREAEASGRFERELEQARERRPELLRRAREYGARVRDLTARAQTLGHDIEGARRRRAAVERALEEERLQLAQMTAQVGRAEAQVEQLEERRRLVERFSQEAPGAGAGARALMEQAERARAGEGSAERPGLFEIVGAVGQLIRVPGDLGNAIEAALAEQIDAVVVERDEAAVEVLDLLREQELGFATLYPLDRLASTPPLNLRNERGVIGVAARLVRTERPYRGLIDALLGRTIVVEDLATARRMLGRGLGSVVTRDGTLLRPNGSLFGGRGGAAAEQFSLRRELDGLPERLEQAREEVEGARARLARQEDVVADAHARVESARRAIEGAEQERRDVDSERESLQRRFAPVAAELRSARAVLLQPDPAPPGAPDGDRLAEAESRVESVGAELATLRDRSQALVSERDRALERVTGAEAQLARLEGELRGLEERREQRAEAERRARALLAGRREQLRAATSEREDLAVRLSDLARRLEAAREQLSEAAARVGPARSALAALEAEAREVTARRSETQARQLESERGLIEAEARLRRHEEAVQGWLEQIADEGMTVDEHGSVRGPLPEGVDPPPRSEFDAAPSGDAGERTEQRLEPAPEPPASPDEAPAPTPTGAPGLPPLRGGREVDTQELRGRVTELRSRIRSLGPVNVEALGELEEERQRAEFLSGQLRDLESTERELRNAIAELRRLIRRRFTETFEEVNAAFSEYFTRFFGGGRAELRLERTAAQADGAEEEQGGSGEENGEEPPASGEADPGVEITAQPPGKRITSLAMLSGGERSMTSVALLFALLSVNPAPVCVLDEVDAALDEANVERFVETLRELTARSQFIVVTHNRRTIEDADAVYGISMGEDSVSRVLSLNLEELPATG